MREEHLFAIHLYPETASADVISGTRETGSVHGGEFLVIEDTDRNTSACDVATDDFVPRSTATGGLLRASRTLARSI